MIIIKNRQDYLKNEDEGLKQLVYGDSKGFFKSLGIEKSLNTGGEVIGLLPTDYSATDKGSFEVDILADFPNMLINLENQSTNLTRDDLRRMQKYAAVISDYKKKPVATVIFCTANPPRKPITLDDNPTLKFTPIIIYSKKTNAHTILNNIKNKFNINNKILDRKECAQLAMLCLYGFKNEEKFIKLISESIELTKKLNNTKEEIELIQTVQIKLIGKYGTKEQIEEILKMSELDDNFILQKYKERGKLEGIEEGKTEGKFDVAVKMVLKKKMSVEEAAEIAEVPLNQLKKAVGY